MDGYQKYRGKCKEMSEALCAKDPSLRLVRGHYDCPFWGPQQHWWTVSQDGTIIDPTKDQFPSKGQGEYVEFNGTLECSECHKTIKEDDIESAEGGHAFCSVKCHMKFVGL